MKQSLKRKWFKQHDYGYGWTPITWQGWLTLAAYIVLIVAGLDKLRPDESKKITFMGILKFAGWVVLWTLALFRICLVTGGKPKWRWGKK